MVIFLNENGGETTKNRENSAKHKKFKQKQKNCRIN